MYQSLFVFFFKFLNETGGKCYVGFDTTCLSNLIWCLELFNFDELNFKKTPPKNKVILVFNIISIQIWISTIGYFIGFLGIFNYFGVEWPNKNVIKEFFEIVFCL